MLQVEYGKRAKRVKKIRMNLSTLYGLVFGQFTNYLRSCIEGPEIWKTTSNERKLLKLLKIIDSLAQIYDKDTEYHHVPYHTLLCRFMLFYQGDYSNLEYKQCFK